MDTLRITVIMVPEKEEDTSRLAFVIFPDTKQHHMCNILMENDNWSVSCLKWHQLSQRLFFPISWITQQILYEIKKNVIEEAHSIVILAFSIW